MVTDSDPRLKVFRKGDGMGDADKVTAYAAGQPGFGGVFYDGNELVVLFTEKVDEQQDSIRGIVDEPGRLVVRAASRTFVEVQSAKARISNRLIGREEFDGVSTVGIAVHEGQFVVEVGIDPYNEAEAERIRAAVHPDEIEVRPQTRPRLL